ncbi:hypothetical protein CJ030_MR3G011071 [Morella rubra]|uniref:Uncharacterized protein n=1 Tax=Morella rubra TaxID=262757 RepID=A0A6A1W327_9ROSI|nr:hypothetical protein CJ030_MR3G011078 [Morella rubra]KAB1219669.1 hypothetical protein CJ030_MR3G011071 [Morella rubra]
MNYYDWEDVGQEAAPVTDQCTLDTPRARKAEIEILPTDQSRPTDQGSQSRLINRGQPRRLADQGSQSRLTDQDCAGILIDQGSQIMPINQDRLGRLTDQGSQSRLTDQDHPGRLTDQGSQIMPIDWDSPGVLTNQEPSDTYAGMPTSQSQKDQDQLKTCSERSGSTTMLFMKYLS